MLNNWSNMIKWSRFKSEEVENMHIHYHSHETASTYVRVVHRQSTECGSVIHLSGLVEVVRLAWPGRGWTYF